MHCVLQAALDLSTSTKPFDSVTAAHLLHLLLPQPHLNQALLHCAQEQDLHFQLPSLPSQPSETVTLELNTLAGKIQMHSPNKCMHVCFNYEMIFIALLPPVVQFLLHSLQFEVSRAESSLLQAAASYPLYGRAHCITAVLQHLNTE